MTDGRYLANTAVSRDSGKVEVTIATQDDVVGVGGARPVRILRVKESKPPPVGATTAGPVHDTAPHISLLQVSIEVARGAAAKAVMADWPDIVDNQQGEAILLNRDQAVDLRAVLDGFIAGAVMLLPSEIARAEEQARIDARREEIVAMITETGNAYGI